MRLPAWQVRCTAVASSHVLTLCLAAVLMSGCAAPPEIPRWFDGFQRFPIRTASVNGHRIAYLDEGQGPPLILLHGYGGSMWQWEYQQLPLSRQFRVITPDLIGSGLSDKPPLDYRPEELIESIRGLMDALGLPTATLIGNSMGGGVAIGMALTHPDRVSRLVLIDSLPDHVRERLVSPLMQRALNTSVPAWLARFGALFVGNRTMEAVLKEIIYDHTLVTPAVLDRSNRNRNGGYDYAPHVAPGQPAPLGAALCAQAQGDPASHPDPLGRTGSPFPPAGRPRPPDHDSAGPAHHDPRSRPYPAVGTTAGGKPAHYGIPATLTAQRTGHTVTEHTETTVLFDGDILWHCPVPA